MSDTVTLTIDDQQITAKAGQTIHEAAMANGILIPNLCYNKKVSHVAACRMCIVDIEGMRPGTPSCATPVAQGMKITAFSERLEKIRRTVLDLALSNHNDDCISCVKDGGCELQDLAFRYDLGRDARRFPPVWKELHKTSDYSSPVLNYDASKCIQCQRCVRACSELQGKGILNFMNRGIRTTVGTGYAEWAQSQCDGCGECAQICPVGAITTKKFYDGPARIRAKDTDKVTRTTCTYCGVGCQLDLHLKQEPGSGDRFSLVEVQGGECAPNFGKLCVKGRFGLDFSTRKDRLTTPLIRRDGELQPASWDEALDLIASRLQAIKAAHGANAIGGFSSARCTNEENYVFQRFIRGVIGTNNIDHCARLCHASTVAGLATTLGSGAMTNSIAELEFAKVILVTGSNTTEAHPVIGTLIKRAVLQHGAKLILVDPRRIELARYATIWLRQAHGTDIAWINGMIAHILAKGLQNQAYIDAHTEGFAAMNAELPDFDLATVERLTGIPAADLASAAELYATAETASIVYSMGITQHAHGTDNVKSLSNLALVCGQIGRPSTGVNPLRGQNNVQGACDMGALPNVYPGYQAVTVADNKAKFEKAWGVSLDDKAGLPVTEMVNGAYDGRIKAVYIMGENPMVSDPNLNHAEEALKKLDFLVVQDIFLTETAALADVVLPACSFLEKDGTFTNTERKVLPIAPVLPINGQARPDWAIVQDLAARFGQHWGYTGVRDIMAEVNRLTPSYAGITYGRMDAGERLHWPCPSVEHAGTPILHSKGPVRGKGLLVPVPFAPAKEQPSAEYPIVLSTGRIIFHYHTGSMTRRSTALTSFIDEAYIEMHPSDIEALGAKDGEMVKVSSRRGTIDIRVKCTKRVAPKNAFIPFHFAEAAANRLTIDALDPVAKIPEFKACAIRIERITT